MIRITSCSTTSSPFFERFRSRSTRYVDASIHSLLDELLDDLGETSRKIFVFCNVPQQEGPFVISRALGNDSYYLIDAQKPKARKRDDSGKESERPWNANLLRRFYS